MDTALARGDLKISKSRTHAAIEMYFAGGRKGQLLEICSQLVDQIDGMAVPWHEPTKNVPQLISTFISD